MSADLFLWQALQDVVPEGPEDDGRCLLLRLQRGAPADRLALARALVPECAVVPREPTQGMTLAANKRVAVVTPDGTWALGRDEAAQTWAAMLAAGEARDE